MRRVALAASLCLLSCGGSSGSIATPSRTARYLDDASFRRAELEAALVSKTNDYAKLRLSMYAREGGWDALPEWNPKVEVILPRDLDSGNKALSTEARALDLAIGNDEKSLRTLGEIAYFRYPVQIAPYVERALASREAAGKYGLWLDDARGVNGFVRVALADGSAGLAMTCATCHTAKREGTFTIGVGNDRFDLGKLTADDVPVGGDEARVAALLAWGPGRVDVTTVAAMEPVRIPDLRPARFLTHLHHAATLKQTDVVTLAIRLETLIIASHQQVLRPPRIVTLALATYLWSLGEALPSRPPTTDAEKRGEKLFATHCTRCHDGVGKTGAPVALDAIGTDPRIALTKDRGTGFYRVPSLRAVASRGPLLHDGSLPTLESLFDPRRLEASFDGGLHGKGAVPGHVFATELPEAARTDLVAYLRTL